MCSSDLVKLLAHLGADLGEWEVRGSFYPFEDDTQDIGSEDLRWANAHIGYVKSTACRASSFRYLDPVGGTTINGATGSFTTADGKTVTVKGGIITSIT